MLSDISLVHPVLRLTLWRIVLLQHIAQSTYCLPATSDLLGTVGKSRGEITCVAEEHKIKNLKFPNNVFVVMRRLVHKIHEIENHA